MGAVEKVFNHWNNKVTGRHAVINQCKESCLNCLSCEYNQNSQFNLVLQNLFNSWKNLGDIKWKDVNLHCGLDKDI